MTLLRNNSNAIALIGPTASGKSGVAIALAAKIGAEILSVDSMQVYCGMDIGTAKPTPAERREVRHHLIDLVEPSESFTVAMFVSAADEVIRDAARRNVPLIITGGTPLYFKSLFEGLFAGPSADLELRARLSATNSEELHRRLQAVDPPAALRIHVNDRRRLVRAIEVFELTGQPISSLQTEWSAPAARHAARWFGLMWEKDELNRRINARVKQMIEMGWVEEVGALLERSGGDLSRTAAAATGYAELTRHLRGEISLDDAIEQIKIATRQLARRQMKWFRRFADVNWLDGSMPIGQLCDAILGS